MAALTDTPAQIAALVAAPAVEIDSVTITHPALGSVGLLIDFYQADAGSTPPNALHAVVTFSGRAPIDLLVSNVIPAGAETNQLRLALGRVLVAAREAVGAS